MKVVYATVIPLTMVEFCTDQLLVSSDLKYFNSATTILDPSIIIISHLHKCFLSRVEVNADDMLFILVNDHIYSRKLFVLVKCVTLFDFKA